MKFRRPLISTDKAMDVDIVNANLFLVWGLSPSDGVISGTFTSYPKHTTYGVAQINFIATGGATSNPNTVTAPTNIAPPVGPSFTFA